MTDDDGVDPGDPIRELMSLELSTSSHFEDGVHRRIHRRLIAAESADLVLRDAFATLMEFITDLLRAASPGHLEEDRPWKARSR